MTIVSLAVLVSMNVQLAQSLKVISILSTQMLVQNVALVLMHVRLKQLSWANTILESMTNGCPSQKGSRFFRLKDNVLHLFTNFIRIGIQSVAVPFSFEVPCHSRLSLKGSTICTSPLIPPKSPQPPSLLEWMYIPSL